MESITVSPGQTIPQFMSENEPRPLQVSDTQWAAVRSSQHFDVSLVTNEGDKVTLSLDAQAAAAYAAFEEIDGDAEDGFSYSKGEMSLKFFQQDSALVVEGDLNADEQRDIRQALESLRKMMQDFIEGDLVPMLAKARKLQGLETISGLEAQMTCESQLVVGRQTQAVAVYEPNGTATEESAPAAPATPELSAIKPKAAAVAKHMARRLKPMKAHRRRTMHLVHGMLRAYRNQMARMNTSAARMIDFISERLNAEVGPAIKG